jgi:protein-disulfide isomerase
MYELPHVLIVSENRKKSKICTLQKIPIMRWYFSYSMFFYSPMYKYIFLCISLFLLASCTPSATDTTSSKNLPQSSVASPTFGSGKHTLTIFADFQCPACIAFANAINPIIEEYAQKGHVTITYKQFPLTSIHKNAERDAIAALCSVEQGKYMEYKKALYAMEQGKSGAKVSDEDRVAAAKDILDTAKLTECLK